MILGAGFFTHSPYLEHARAEPATEQAFHAAVLKASSTLQALKPDLAVIFFPDHFNGFFYDLMPAFCIGAAALSIGDFGTVPGPLDVPEGLALDCVRHCLADGVDVAVSLKMSLDHGAVQPLEFLAEAGPMPEILPIFVNCAAPPLPGFSRVRALGAAVGRWAEQSQRRVVLLGSGGLSHDPPLPRLSAADAAQRRALIDNRNVGHRGRLERQRRVFRLGETFASGGETSLRPLNPEWDETVLAAFARGDLYFADDWDEGSVTERAGCGGHEVRTWAAALAGLQTLGRYDFDRLFYAMIPQWITSSAVATALPRRAAPT